MACSLFLLSKSMQQNVYFSPTMIKVERKKKEDKRKKEQNDTEKRKEMKRDSFPKQIPLGTPFLPLIICYSATPQEVELWLTFFFKKLFKFQLVNIKCILASGVQYSDSTLPHNTQCLSQVHSLIPITYLTYPPTYLPSEV